MHYHPFAQNLWFPLGVFLLSGIIQIPLSIITTIVTSLFGGAPSVFATGQ